MATKLLSSHQTDGGEFVAGQLCATEEQRKYYSQTLDPGPMVTHWMTSGYELPFSSIPPNPLSAPNWNELSFIWVHTMPPTEAKWVDCPIYKR